MPYDLYGTYYASRRDAENAELAQIAAIDADFTRRELQDNIERQQREEYHIWQYINMLESRICALEQRSLKNRLRRLFQWFKSKHQKEG